MLDIQNRYIGLAILASLLALAIGVFFLFSYNSGYGFDALEYLVIARSLLDGYRMYAFVPSKSPGLYLLVASWLGSGLPQNHLGVSVMVTVFFLLFLASGWFVADRLYNRQTAILTSVFIALSALTMELNFLEPDGLVASSGLLAALFLWKGSGREAKLHATWWFTAGLVIGLGCCLKTVTTLYWLGALVFGCWMLLLRRVARKSFFAGILAVTAGFILPQALEMGFFFVTGRSQEFLLWTYVYPFLYYPANTLYLGKLMIKCGWLLVALLGALYFSFRWKMIGALIADSRTILILAMAGASAISLLKSQASHYLVPSAAFLIIFVSSVFATGWNNRRFAIAGKGISILAAIAIFICIAAAAIYRPDVMRRVTGIKDYSWENRIAQRVSASVEPQNRLFALQNSRLLYWVSKRYPPLPIIDTERQTTYWLKFHPDAITNALDDPRLTMIEIDDTQLVVDDPLGIDDRHVKAALGQLMLLLPGRFEPIVSEVGYKLWVRRKQI